MITEVELGWMAGVVSIKGRTILKKNKNRNTQKVIAVRSQRRSIIDRLGVMTDRNVNTDKPVTRTWDQRGCVTHCPEAHVHHDTSIPETYEWTVTGISAAIVIYNLMPYLHGDEWQSFMQAALDDVVKIGPGSGATKASVKRLSEIGWRIPPQVMDLAVSSTQQGRLAQFAERLPDTEEVVGSSPSSATRCLSLNWCMLRYTLQAPLAQWIERLATNQEVGGSSPSGRAMHRRRDGLLSRLHLASLRLLLRCIISGD
jgi:hypothetical protein